MFRRYSKYLLLSVFLGGLIAAPVSVYADDSHAPRHDIVQGPHVEGHIAFLHAELGITPAQEQLWAPVAAAMREDVNNLQDTEGRVDHGDHLTAMQYLQNRVVFANLRAQGEERFLKAFRPLYGSLSDEQKQMADELLMPRADHD